MLALNAKLQAYREHADKNRNFGGMRELRLGYFMAYPPEVRKLAWEHLSLLCVKHKAKLEARPSFKGPLVATATRLALDELGLREISRKGFYRLRAMRKLKVDLGIQDKNPDGGEMNNRRKRAKALAKMQKLNVSQLPLEC